MNEKSIDDIDDIISSVMKKKKSEDPVIDEKQTRDVHVEEVNGHVKSVVEIIDEPKITSSFTDRAGTIVEIIRYCDVEGLNYDPGSVTTMSVLVYEVVPGGMFTFYKLKMGINPATLQLQPIGNDRVLVKVKE